ncbi:14562_t:CDS:1, partial [Gigaspora rosea]
IEKNDDQTTENASISKSNIDAPMDIDRSVVEIKQSSDVQLKYSHNNPYTVLNNETTILENNNNITQQNANING